MRSGVLFWVVGSDGSFRKFTLILNEKVPEGSRWRLCRVWKELTPSEDLLESNSKRGEDLR